MEVVLCEGACVFVYVWRIFAFLVHNIIKPLHHVAEKFFFKAWHVYLDILVTFMVNENY